MGLLNIFSKEKKEKLDQGLSRTKDSVFTKLSRAVAGKSKVDDEVLDNLEEILVTSDVGVETTLKIIERIEERVARDKCLVRIVQHRFRMRRSGGQVIHAYADHASGALDQFCRTRTPCAVMRHEGHVTVTPFGEPVVQALLCNGQFDTGNADLFKAKGVRRLFNALTQLRR